MVKRVTEKTLWVGKDPKSDDFDGERVKKVKAGTVFEVPEKHLKRLAKHTREATEDEAMLADAKVEQAKAEQAKAEQAKAEPAAKPAPAGK